VNFNTQGNDMSALSLANVEALAQESGTVVIPCCYKKSSTCSFNMIGQDGSSGTGTVGDARNC
jgi:hypothetical protein